MVWKLTREILWSMPRRALVRFAELTFLGQILEFAGLIDGFSDGLFDPNHFLGIFLSWLAASLVIDLMDASLRPDPHAADTKNLQSCDQGKSEIEKDT
jgi:hypothetical protein